MKTLHLARWETRFWAWLIDFIILSILASFLSGPVQAIWHEQFAVPAGLGLNSILLFAYWTIFEGYRGQSIGKMALNIRVTDREGEKIGFFAAALESIGKAFLLPLDCLIGWLAMPGSKLRLFNRLSNTIVIVTEYAEPEGVQHIKEEE